MTPSEVILKALLTTTLSLALFCYMQSIRHHHTCKSQYPDIRHPLAQALWHLLKWGFREWHVCFTRTTKVMLSLEDSLFNLASSEAFAKLRDLTLIHDQDSNCCLFFFFFMVAPTACGSSRSSDWIWSTAATDATAGATPHPLTHCVQPELEPTPPLQHEPLRWGS